MSFWGRLSRNSAALARRREIAVTGTAAVLVVLTGTAFAASSGFGRAGHPLGGTAAAGTNQTTARTHASKPKPPPVLPLNVVSVTPAPGSTGIGGTGDIKVKFDADLSPSTPLPRLSPKIDGSWKVAGDTATFTPDAGFMPETRVTVTVPAGVRAGDAKHPLATKRKSKTHFTTGMYSTLRLQELLAKLGYLPLTFTPSDSSGRISSGDEKAQLAAAYDAPPGTFSFDGSYPSQLTGKWAKGSPNMIDSGAIRAFQFDQGLTMDGVAGPDVWSRLLSAVADGKSNPHGYTYALATQGTTADNLKVWHNGKLILTTLANMGVAGAPTKDGTYPVYSRLAYQVMKGTNPDGTKYADPVHWIAYFDGGDAIHGFQRASYGFYQSVGCVEIPVATAQRLYPYLTYGTLVTVQGKEAPAKRPAAAKNNG